MLNYGLAWNVDRFRNYDLSKPQLLAPILGADGVGPGETLCGTNQLLSMVSRWPVPSASRSRFGKEGPTTAGQLGSSGGVFGGTLKQTDLVPEREDLQLHGGTGSEHASESSEQWQNKRHRTGNTGRQIGICGRHRCVYAGTGH